MNNDVDEDDMEEWMKLSDAEMDAEIEKENKKYADWWNSLSLDQRVIVLRRRYLKLAIDNRKRIKDPQYDSMPFVQEMWKKGLMRAKLGLLKVREYRKSGGIFPGSS